MPSRKDLANAVRFLAIDAIEKSKSGHPGAPMGMADMAEALWRGVLKHNPADPAWPDRDRFVLSNGHASMLLYAVLHLTGYDLGLDDLRNFRQFGTRAPGHPEYGVTPGVEVTTGPLGQGIAMAVGLALAERLLAATFNRDGFLLVDHRTFVFLGDGCLMEGVTQEACSLAGTLGLGKLTALYDDNGISIDGKVNGWFRDDTPARFEALGWHVIRDVDGNNAEKISAALTLALGVTDRPSLICCKTVIGYGSPHKAGSAAMHGSPLGPEEIQATREALKWPYPPFEIPQEIYAAWDCRVHGQNAQNAWEDLFAAYSKKYPDLAREFTRRMTGALPADFAGLVKAALEVADAVNAPMATRVAGKNVLDILATVLPELIGGAADLSGSVGTFSAASVPVTPSRLEGNYIHYGVREAGMGALMNGLAAHGGFIPYGGTFLVFSDYAKNPIRLSALMRRRVIWVLSHDSIGVGEDGPTHQPIEHIAELRLTPGLDVWRPCDLIETSVAWASAIERVDGPSCLLLCRQNVPQLKREAAQIEAVRRGGYILRDCSGAPEILLLATGSEVSIALDAFDSLTAKGRLVRLVSMPCCEVFERQDAAYKDSVILPGLECRVAVEAASADWWWKYVGLKGRVLGMTDFGESAPGGVLYRHFGFTAENLVKVVEELL